MKKIDGKESNTANGVNIATELNEFKDVLFSKKIDEISLSCSDCKRFALDFFFFSIFFLYENINIQYNTLNKKITITRH